MRNNLVALHNNAEFLLEMAEEDAEHDDKGAIDDSAQEVIDTLEAEILTLLDAVDIVDSYIEAVATALADANKELDRVEEHGR